MEWADARRAGERRGRGFLGEPKGGGAAFRLACTAGRGESRDARQERESPIMHRPPPPILPHVGGSERGYACVSALASATRDPFGPQERGRGRCERAG